MKIFLAGGTGAIGVPLIRALTAAGHEVTALTRSEANASTLRELGASPAVADALDADALRRAVAAARPAFVIHQLTALPKGGPRSAKDLEPTNRLRVDGTRNLIDAALAAGARRIVVGSFALFRGGEAQHVPATMRAAADAVRSMESQTLDASRRGARDGARARSRAGRERVRHRRRPRGEHQRDQQGCRGGGGRAAAARDTVVAAAPRRAVPRGRACRSHAALECEGARRSRLAAGLSDH